MFSLHQDKKWKEVMEKKRINPTHWKQLLTKTYLWKQTASESVGSFWSRVNHVSLREGSCLFITESLATSSNVGVKWKSSSCVGMYGARLSKSRSHMSLKKKVSTLFSHKCHTVSTMINCLNDAFLLSLDNKILPTSLKVQYQSWHYSTARTSNRTEWKLRLPSFTTVRCMRDASSLWGERTAQLIRKML